MSMINIRWATCFPPDVIRECSIGIQAVYDRRDWQALVIDRSEIPVPVAAQLEAWCDLNGVDVDIMTVVASYVPATPQYVDGVQITAYARMPETA